MCISSFSHFSMIALIYVSTSMMMIIIIIVIVIRIRQIALFLFVCVRFVPSVYSCSLRNWPLGC
jgi:hypothetical protein